MAIRAGSTQRATALFVAVVTSAGTAPSPPPMQAPMPPGSCNPATNLTGRWRLFLDDTHISSTSGAAVTRRFHSFARASTPFLSLAANENLAVGASGVFPYHSVLPPDPSPGCGSELLWRLWYDCWRDVWGVRAVQRALPCERDRPTKNQAHSHS